MELRIHTTIFLPRLSGEPYYVVASTFPESGPEAQWPKLHRKGFAGTMWDAKDRCCELSRALRDFIERQGHVIKAMHCGGCPTPANPTCGRLARIRSS